jgi:predicted outer membrane protein
MATKLKTMKGADFERENLRMMVQGHEKELAMIDTKKSEVTNSELSGMLDQLKPVLQHHADAAKELQKNEPTAKR